MKYIPDSLEWFMALCTVIYDRSSPHLQKTLFVMAIECHGFKEYLL